MFKPIVFAVLLGALATPALAEYQLGNDLRDPCNGIPQAPPASAQQEPTIPYKIYMLAIEDVQPYCDPDGSAAHAIVSCILPPDSDGITPIVVSDFMGSADLACTLLYEKAHLPPNNWTDPAWEDHTRKGVPYTP